MQTAAGEDTLTYATAHPMKSIVIVKRKQQVGGPHLAQNSQDIRVGKLSGQTVVGEIIRNMELGKFELAYSVLLPCVFSVYLHPEDYSRLSGVFPLVVDDARKALRARVAELNNRPKMLGLPVGKAPKEYK